MTCTIYLIASPSIVRHSNFCFSRWNHLNRREELRLQKQKGFLLARKTPNFSMWSNKRATTIWSILWNFLQMCLWITDLISQRNKLLNASRKMWYSKAWLTFSASEVWRPSVIVSVTTKTSIWVERFSSRIWMSKGKTLPSRHFRVDHDDYSGKEKQ